MPILTFILNLVFSVKSAFFVLISVPSGAVFSFFFCCDTWQCSESTHTCSACGVETEAIVYLVLESKRLTPHLWTTPPLGPCGFSGRVYR